MSPLIPAKPPLFLFKVWAHDNDSGELYVRKIAYCSLESENSLVNQAKIRKTMRRLISVRYRFTIKLIRREMKNGKLLS
jgi:hypothetical protein